MGILTIFKGFLTIVLFLFEFVYASAIEIKRFACSEFIRNKRPVNVSDVFPASIKKIYCFSKIKTKEYPTYIYHIWYYNGKLINKIKLNINYATYRTWSYSRNLGVGTYKVVLADKDGTPLAEKEFVVSNKETQSINASEESNQVKENSNTNDENENKNEENKITDSKNEENRNENNANINEEKNLNETNPQNESNEDIDVEQLEKKLLEEDIKKDISSLNKNEDENLTEDTNTQKGENSTQEVDLHNHEEQVQLSNPYGLPSEEIKTSQNEEEKIKKIEEKKEEKSYFFLLLAFYGIFLVVLLYLYKRIFK